MFHVEHPTTRPTPAHAIARRLVQLPDGRVGRLVWCPPPNARPADGHGRGVTNALVIVHGRHYRVPATDLALLPDDQPEAVL